MSQLVSRLSKSPSDGSPLGRTPRCPARRPPRRTPCSELIPFHHNSLLADCAWWPATATSDPRPGVQALGGGRVASARRVPTKRSRRLGNGPAGPPRRRTFVASCTKHGRTSIPRLVRPRPGVDATYTREMRSHASPEVACSPTSRPIPVRARAACCGTEHRCRAHPHGRAQPSRDYPGGGNPTPPVATPNVRLALGTSNSTLRRALHLAVRRVGALGARLATREACSRRPPAASRSAPHPPRRRRGSWPRHVTAPHGEDRALDRAWLGLLHRAGLRRAARRPWTHRRRPRDRAAPAGTTVSPRLARTTARVCVARQATPLDEDIVPLIGR